MTGRLQSGVRIAGKEIEPAEPAPIDPTDPVTGRRGASIAGGGIREARLATGAATMALDDWQSTTPRERASILRRIAEEIEGAGAELSRLTTAETGKRHGESEAEVQFSASYFRWYADFIAGNITDVVRGSRDLGHFSTRRPLGVVAVVTPWNFPLSTPARKLAPLLAAGCTAVFKPSEVAPRTSLLLAQLIDAVTPPGVLNTVIAPPAALGDQLLEDDRIRGLTFTGSTAVGRIVARQAAGRFQRSVLELGGNAPFLVLDDADPEAAARCLKIAKYRNNGQSCIAANQVWVHEAVAGEFYAQVEATTRELRVGDPMDPTTELGPMAVASAQQHLTTLVNEASEAGATVVSGTLPDDLPGGNFVAPRLCMDADPNAHVWATEAFGPVTLMRTFSDLDAAVAQINRSPVGLAAYICTTDRFRGAQLAAALEVGVVGVNTSTPNDPSLPFGGLKGSGWGREGGSPGIDVFLEHQLVAVTPCS